MTAMYKEWVITLLDLQWVCITCKKCGTSLTLDMARLFEAKRTRPNFAPVICQVCEEKCDTSLESLNDLQNAYRGLFKLAKANPDCVTFVSRCPEGAAE